VDAMRVLYVLGRGGPGGIERHVQALVRSIGPMGVEAHVCVLTDAGQVTTQMQADGVPVHVLGARHGHDPALFFSFCKLLGRLKPDVVHFHELHFLPALAMGLFPRIALVCSEHCSIPHAPSLTSARILWRTVGRRIDRVLPVSHHTGRMLAECLGVPAGCMSVVHNGLDLDGQVEVQRGSERPAGLGGGSKLVGGVGRLAAQKDWHAFLEVARHLSRFRRDVEFAVVGDGPMRAALEREALGLGVADRVRWLGSRPDALDLIRAFDVFLLTSLHEELPTTLLEAFSVRTPVAGFVPEGGTSEILDLCSRPAGAFIEGRPPEALARAVSGLLDDPEGAARMTEEAFRVVHDHFNMRDIASQLSRIYRSAAAQRARAGWRRFRTTTLKDRSVGCDI